MSQQAAPKKKRSKNDAPRRRGPHGWVTDVKYTHLQGEIPGFRSAQAEGKLEEFWPGMHTRFIAGFPMGPLTPEEITAGVKMEDKLSQEFKVSRVA